MLVGLLQNKLQRLSICGLQYQLCIDDKGILSHVQSGFNSHSHLSELSVSALK